MVKHDTDELFAIVFDYIERYGLTELARDYFLQRGKDVPTSLDGTPQVHDETATYESNDH